MIAENYLASAKHQFLFYKSLAEKAMEQLEPEQLFFRHNEECNSIAMIVQHLAGNMLSRWTDFLTSDGEKEWRKRDEEFEHVLTDHLSVMQKWEQGWNCLISALQNLQPEQLEQTVLIRNEPHSIVEAVNRQLAHYPYHVGQIVLLAKELRGPGFKSLSIPRNQSEEFNRQKSAGLK
jgi:hypothetical protein